MMGRIDFHIVQYGEEIYNGSQWGPIICLVTHILLLNNNNKMKKEKKNGQIL